MLKILLLCLCLFAEFAIVNIIAYGNKNETFTFQGVLVLNTVVTLLLGGAILTIALLL